MQSCHVMSIYVTTSWSCSVFIFLYLYFCCCKSCCGHATSGQCTSVRTLLPEPAQSRGWIKLLQQRGGFPSAKQAEPSELSGGQLCSDHQTTPSPPHRTVQMFTSHSPPATLQCFQRNRQASVCSCCSDTQPGQSMSTVRT